MTLKAVHRELKSFLSTKASEVLCLRGRWGIGKTYQWNKVFESAKGEASIPYNYYSYVSLFGVNSLSELRLAIFENQTSLKTDETSDSIDKLDRYISSKIDWRKKTRLLSLIPGLSGLTDVEAAAALSSLTTREQLICLDDIERRGRDLDVKDILGLVSFLKEQRACKIVVILNEEELISEDLKEFRSNLEKVADISIIFDPTAEEATQAAFENPDEISKKVSERCVKLGITNIRVIRRIDRLVRALQPLLETYSSEVFETAISSVALFSWANDQPSEAPSLNFIRSLSSDWAILASDEEIEGANGVEAAWRAKLEDYGYALTDEFDLALLDGVIAGYFTPEQIASQAKAVDDRVVAAKADGSFERAWDAYHGSFENNATEVLDEIYRSFKKNFHYITPLNLNGTVCLLKELGREDQAKEIIDLYVNGRSEDHSFFDLSEYAFATNITDPDVRAALDAKAASIKPPQNFKEALLSIKDGWTPEQMNTISEAPVETYIETFKSSSGTELRRLLSNAMQFSRIVNPSPEMSKITARTKEALKEIGKESPINARRVKRFGVRVSEEGAKGEA